MSWLHKIYFSFLWFRTEGILGLVLNNFEQTENELNT